MVDLRHPLPCYRVQGKVLVKVVEFEQWMAAYRKAPQPNDLDKIVDDIVSRVSTWKAA